VIDRKLTRSGDVRYEVRYRAADGKERSRTFRTKKEAERHERAQKTAMERGLWVDPQKGRVTLEQWALEWQRTVVHLRSSTRRIYDTNLRLHILPELGGYEMGKLSPSLLRAWLADLSAKPGRRGRPLAPSTVAQAYRTLNRVLAAAVDDEILGRNPLAGVKPPRVEREEMRFLGHDDVATLIDVIDPRYRAMVLVAAYGGLRAGELVALRARHLDLLHQSLTVIEQAQRRAGGGFEVQAPKSAAGRRAVSLPRFVVDALADHVGTFSEPGPDGLVFPSPHGGHLRLENFRKRVWEPAVRQAGLAPLRFHDLRHTCASLAIAAGADVKVLQRMLGHSSAALTLDRYGHLMPGQAQDVARRLDEMASRARPQPVDPAVPLASAAGFSRDR
jgi:integrase